MPDGAYEMTNQQSSETANCELQNLSPSQGGTENETMATPILSPQSRYRIIFGTKRALAYSSVLELGRVWERSLRRAGIPLKYSQGFNPRPKLNFAAPLPVGCGSEADLMDILLEVPWTPEAILTALMDKTPEDLSVYQVTAVDDGEPALSEQLVGAEYRVWLRDTAQDNVQSAVHAFLASETLPMAKRGRKYHGKTYDLRPLVEALRVEDTPAPWTGLWMRVRARPGATGRPDEVLKALNLAEAPRRCIRTCLILSND